MKYLKAICIFVLVLLFSRCAYKLDHSVPPKDLIPKDTFTMALYDIMVVESYYKMQDLNIQSFHKSLPAAVDSIFKKYSLDSMRFNESMTYYSSEQQELLDIYKNIQDSLILNTAKFEHN